MKTKITINFDGSCLKNPNGAMGFGCIIKIDRNPMDWEYKLHGGEAAKTGNTNNLAEYKAVLLALDYLLNNSICDSLIQIYGDSKLVIQQLKGSWNIKTTPGVKPAPYAKYAFEAREKVYKLIAENNNKFKFTWIPREQNTEADELSNIFHGGSAVTNNFDYKSFMKKNQF